MRSRGSTYRVQLHAGFTFDDAAHALDYLDRLGVTDLYCSPFLQAAAGSTHGYDVVDPTRVNDELGGEPGLRRLGSALAARGMGLTADIVPNHMAIDGRANRWWWDVLEHGRSSRFAGHFDIDWTGDDTGYEPILMPILGDHYGRELEAGRLQLRGVGGSLTVAYCDREVPINLPADGVDIDRINDDVDQLDRLLSRQHYRLAYWRTANDELNYRRFFTIQSLVGVRVEDPEVFADIHATILGLVREGVVTGLRVDHVDGLRDPGGYTERLRAAAESYIVVEKILAPSEELPGEWPVEGTTGYDFLSAVNGLFVDPAAEASLTDCYALLTGESDPYEEVARAAKQQIMIEEMATEIERLVRLLVEVCKRHRRHRDRTRRELRDALRELISGFGVYRTYPRPGRPARPADRDHVAGAVRRAVLRRPDFDPELLEFLGRLALLDLPGDVEARFALSLAQVTPAVMAKGSEDTAFYRYNRLVSLNEVGGCPGRFGTSVAEFHATSAAVARKWPATMLTLSTHDTKRSADVRARINLLSEIPSAWAEAIRDWMDRSQSYLTDGAPDRNARYLLFQTLVGVWPIEPARLVQYMAKAAREAKAFTSWASPVPEYDAALGSFVERTLADQDLMRSIERFLARHRIVDLGFVSSLAQHTLLLTAPGIPDIYQGSEVWNLSLVDPDNRRPVDYAARRRLLDRVDGLAATDTWTSVDDGGPKLWLIARILRHRRSHPDRYQSCRYEPLRVQGTKAAHAVAFARDNLAVLVPRLVVGLAGDWLDTTVTLPAGTWRDVVSEERHQGGDQKLDVLTGAFPVAVLDREGE
jgi:(1->4)-alpha-D-glucan 1-alpha-D-glucosylmutase